MEGLEGETIILLTLFDLGITHSPVNDPPPPPKALPFSFWIIDTLSYV